MATVNELAVDGAVPQRSDAKPTWRGGVNIVLSALAIALGAYVARDVVPWWSSLSAAGVLVAAYGLSAGLFKDLYGDALKQWRRAVMTSGRTTVAVIIVLVAEGALIAIVPQLAPPIRVVPGPLLHQALGYPNQTLELEIDGKRYTLEDPQPKPFYARTSRVRLNHLLGGEDKQVLTSAIREVFRTEATDDGLSEAEELRKKWVEGAPLVMEGAESGTGASALIDKGRPVALVVRELPLNANGGMKTYVAEIAPR